MEQKILLSQLAADTLKGLSSNPKYLLSKYFYDDEGSRIFQDIMHMPEYYLTDCESKIFSEQTSELCLALHHKTDFFNLVELGSGDGLKTKILLKHLLEKDIKFQYTPVDISAIANRQLVESLKAELPALQVEAKTGDYFNKLKSLNGHASIPKTILFLGSNIGNFSEEETIEFIGQLAAYSNVGDKVLIGFDLKKSPKIIMDAYNDPHGHTRRFNLNHLERLNRELDAGFDTSAFEQHTSYNPLTGEVKSFLVSNTEQEIYVDALGKRFHFKQWEPVFMELSRKFDLETIEKLAKDYGFSVIKNFIDSRNYFVDSLWMKR
jgi:dimethylhistidine N-methyltransferase